MSKPKVLVVDDEEDILLLYKNILKKDHLITAENNASNAIKRIGTEHFDLVILDIIMPDMNGIEALKAIKSIDPSLEVIMVTASKEIKPAVDSLKLGAFDYIVKPFEIEDLLSSVGKAIERKDLVKENAYLKQTLDENISNNDLIGKSDRIRPVFEMIENASSCNSTILITGESGTGKEIVARSIHRKSKRKNAPYIIVNCAAIPDNLIESELFGHERGSFTGAMERKIGKFEMADGGTIFLDEIGEMPPQMQAKLLRVIQESTIERVGGGRSIPVDVRVIAATNIDLPKAIENKKFREDLFYRLNVIPIYMPSLRERTDDIQLFVDHFITKFNKEFNKNVRGITKEALSLFIAYSWPGNIRELENVIERMIALSNDSLISVEHLPNEMMTEKGSAYISGQYLKDSVNNFEKKLVKNALDNNKGNQSRAAKELGLHRTTLISKMETFGLK